MNPLDIILHLDKYLDVLIQKSGLGTYAVLFLIVFSETGLVVAPFLPGDSLLFAAGTFASRGSLNVFVLWILLSIAAVLGDTVNYWIGHAVGPKVFRQKKGLLFRKEYLERTHLFYEKYGTKTIMISRFLPIIRTFAPFVAGIGRMSYPRFFMYNIIGGITWVTVFTWGGYWFGNIRFVQENFSLVILAIIIISFLPLAWEYLTHRWHAKKYEHKH